MTSLREEAQQLKAENESLRQELANVKHNARQQPPDLEAMRDRILKSLKLGTQAPGYKAARKALDQFIKEISP